VPFSRRNFFSPQSVEEPTQVTHQSPLNSLPDEGKLTTKNMNVSLVREARLGFAGPEDRVVSLNIPLAMEDRQNIPYHSFDIEYDAEQPDKLTIRLLELDQHGFIRTALQSTSVPGDLLADLVTRRKATAEEVAEWKNIVDED
jgi:hypothetical protein